MARLKLTISDWQDGVWGNRNYYFESLEEAKKKLRREKGRAKVYNNKNQLVYSENVTESAYSGNN